MGTMWYLIPRLSAKVTASLTEWTVDQEEGMRMPVTLSLPKASVAKAATTAESKPPERPSTARDIPA